MNKSGTKKLVATLTSVATVAMLTAGAFLPMAAGAVDVCANAGTFVMKWGEFGDNDDQVKYPNGIAHDSLGNIYLVNTGYRPGYSGIIQKWDSQGNYLSKWSFFPNDGYPLDVTVDSSGNIYAVTNQGIYKLDPTGDSKSLLYQYLNSGFGIATDSLGNIYVGERNIPRISKFSPSGAFLMSWGSIGFENGQFTSLNGIAIDVDDNVYVADNRIQKFRTDGTWVQTMTLNNNGQPFGISVDNTGSLITTTDVNNHRVVVLNADGQQLIEWGSQGAGDGQFESPRGVTEYGGKLYIADMSNNRVQVFTACAIPPGTGRPTVSINSVTTDGGTDLEVSAAINDPDGDPLSGSVSVKCELLGPPTSVTLSSANSFTDPVAGETGAIYRPNTDQTGLISDPAGSFVYACGPCSAVTSEFVESFRPPQCGSLYGNAALMVSKDICAKSTVTGNTYTLDVTAYSSQTADPNASYNRMAYTVGNAASQYSALNPPYHLEPLALSGMPPGSSCTLTITASDGMYPRAIDTATFTYGGESQVLFVYGTPTPPPQIICQAKPGKACICHYPDGNPENVQVIEVAVNAVKAHLKHGDDMFGEDTQTCTVSIARSSIGNLLALAAAALAAGLGIGIYARRKK